MNPLNETLAADPGTEIATGALAQSTVVPIDNEPAPRLIVEPPLPGRLAPAHGQAVNAERDGRTEQLMSLGAS